MTPGRNLSIIRFGRCRSPPLGGAGVGRAVAGKGVGALLIAHPRARSMLLGWRRWGLRQAGDHGAEQFPLRAVHLLLPRLPFQLHRGGAAIGEQQRLPRPLPALHRGHVAQRQPDGRATALHRAGVGTRIRLPVQPLRRPPLPSSRRSAGLEDPLFPLQRPRGVSVGLASTWPGNRSERGCRLLRGRGRRRRGLKKKGERFALGAPQMQCLGLQRTNRIFQKLISLGRGISGVPLAGLAPTTYWPRD